MKVNGEGRLIFFVKDEDGNYHRVSKAVNPITEWTSTQQVIDKSQTIFPIQREFSASIEIDEDKIRMANAKDVTPRES